MGLYIEMCTFSLKLNTSETKLLISCLQQSWNRLLQQSPQRSLDGDSISQGIQTQSVDESNVISSMLANHVDSSFKVSQDSNHFSIISRAATLAGWWSDPPSSYRLLQEPLLWSPAAPYCLLLE